jgi:LacI family repressor for deo operon, udp, cdd, tsx, nupC, and nupG
VAAPLTTVTAPVEQAGRTLIDLLLGPRDVQRVPHIVLPTVLRVRDSTGPAASQ